MLVFDPLHLGLDCDQSVNPPETDINLEKCGWYHYFLEDFEQGMFCDVNCTKIHLKQ